MANSIRTIIYYLTILVICLPLLGGCLGGSSDSGSSPNGDDAGENGDDDGDGDNGDDGGNGGGLGDSLDDDRFGDRVDDPITEGPLSFNSVALEDSEAAPFDLVEVTGLIEGSSLAELYVEYEIEETGAAIGPGIVSPMTPLVQPDLDVERFFLVVPPHVGETREFRLKVTDGSSYSQALSLMVDPLPEPQEGAFDDLLSVLEDMIRTTSEAYQLSYPDDLDGYLDDPASFNPAFTPLLRAYDAIANENNPNSLVNRELEEDAIELMERVIPHMGLLDDYQALDGFLGSDNTLISQAVDALTVQHGQRGFDMAGNDLTLDPIYEIDGPEQLSEMMHEYREARLALQNIRLAEDIANDAVTAMSLTAIVASGGTLTKGAAAAKTTAEAILTAASVAIATEELALGFYPCCMVDLRLEATPATSGGSEIRLQHEDVAENQLEIHDVLVDVTSDPDLGEELMERLLGLVADQISDQLGDMYAANDVDEEFIGFGTDQLFDQLGLNTDIYFEWDGISITGNDVDEWLIPELEVFGDGSAGPIIWERVMGAPTNQLHYRLDPERFFGNENSPTVLRVTPDWEKFPVGFWFRMDSLPGETNLLFGRKIDVRFERSVHRVEAGEPYELVFNIHHSVEPEFKDLEVTEGEIVDVEELSEGRWQVTYLPPASLGESFMAEMSVLADADGGVRHPDNSPTPREGRAYLLPETEEEWLSLTGVGCLEPDETVTIVADVNPSDETLSWDSSAGHINPSESTHKAVFTATVNTGDVEVTATAEESGLTATTIVPVREDCTCVAAIHTNQGSLVSEDPGHGMAAGFMDLFMSEGIWAFFGVFEDPADAGSMENQATFMIEPQMELVDGVVSGMMTYRVDEYTTVTPTEGQFEVYWDHAHRLTLRYAGPGLWIYFDWETEPQGGYTPINLLVRPRIVKIPSDVDTDALTQAMIDAASGADTVIDRGDYYEHLPTGATWTNCN